MNSSFSRSRLGVMQPHQQRALARVVGRIHRDHVLGHGELVTVLVDDRAHVVALERDREGRERPDDGVARRERVRVAVDLAGLVVPGHRDDAEVRQREHGALGPQRLEVGVGILDQRLVGEEVDRFDVLHGRRTSRSSLGDCPN